jgi:YD repeat-containing protein
MFFIIAVFLYVTLVGYEHKIRRLHGTLQLLSEFHKTHIHVHKCESWENYIEDLRSEEKKSTRLQNLRFYINCCERIGSVLPEPKTPISEYNIGIPNDTIYVCCSKNSEYDRRGQQILSESKEFSTQYTYTPTKFIESIIQDDKSVLYSYNVAGQRIVAKTPAVTSIYRYDGMGRLTKIDHQNIAYYDYQGDAANRINAMNDGKYDYDKTSQLIATNYAKLPAEKYNYDLNGNRSNYQTGKNNQLLHDGENAYEYDDEGNRISKGLTKYFWDHRNRLVKVETPQETVEYVYDYKNRLVRRSTSKGSEFFVHDGWQIVLTLDKNGTVTNKFLWGAKQDELIAQNSVYTLWVKCKRN